MKFREYFRDIMGKAQLPSHGYCEDLAQRYEEPHRWYHNKCHIVSVIDRINELSEAWQWRERGIALIAALYHDAVYVPGWGSNEEMSAQMAFNHLSAMNADAVVTRRVMDAIRATKNHDPGEDVAAKLLVDADLYELGTAKYDYNSRRIRKEFGDIEDSHWIEGRKNFLHTFLLRDRIYHLGEQWDLEAAARLNMENELVRLITGDGASEVHYPDSAEG